MVTVGRYTRKLSRAIAIRFPTSHREPAPLSSVDDLHQLACALVNDAGPVWLAANALYVLHERALKRLLRIARRHA
jgi:hypothetical protein